MNLAKLVNVLVVQGALLVGACDQKGGDETGSKGEGPEGDGAGVGSSTGETAGGGSGGDAVSAGPSTGDGAPGSTEGATDDGAAESAAATTGEAAEGSVGSTGDVVASSDEGAPLECSETPEVTDPCGCPCCWATDCVNTDEVCCAPFTELCTP